jgi:hypothetical protein
MSWDNSGKLLNQSFFLDLTVVDAQPAGANWESSNDNQFTSAGGDGSFKNAGADNEFGDNSHGGDENAGGGGACRKYVLISAASTCANRYKLRSGRSFRSRMS